jgi:hypothetical protein
MTIFHKYLLSFSLLCLCSCLLVGIIGICHKILLTNRFDLVSIFGEYVMFILLSGSMAYAHEGIKAYRTIYIISLWLAFSLLIANYLLNEVFWYLWTVQIVNYFMPLLFIPLYIALPLALLLELFEKFHSQYLLSQIIARFAFYYSIAGLATNYIIDYLQLY